MASVATLTIDLLGNSAKLTSELRKSTANTKNWAKDTRKVVNSAGKSFTATGAVGAAALTSIYASAASTADQLAKMSDRIGEAPERLVGLQHAAELTGAGADTLNSSLERMVKRLGEAQSGTGSAAKTLDQLGLSTKEFFALSPADQFSAIAENVSGLETQQEKAAAAAALFGREGLDLINTLDLGSEGLAAMSKEAGDLGLSMNRLDLAKIEAANDSFYRAQQVTEGFGRSLAVQVAPLLDAVSQKFVESAKEAGGFGDTAKSIVDATATGIGVMADGLHGIKILYVSIKQVLAEFLNASVQGFALLDSATTNFLNSLPGVVAEQNSSLQAMAANVSANAQIMRDEYQSLLLEPIPSEKIKGFIEDAYKKSEAAAKQVAESTQVKIPLQVELPEIKSIASGDGAANDEAGDSKKAEQAKAENDRLLEIHRDHLESVRNERLKAEGKLVDLEQVRFEKQRAQLEEELNLLREKGLLTAEIEDESRQAQLDAEYLHQQRITELQSDAATERREMLQMGYSTLLDAANAYFDGMEGKEAGYARMAISLGQSLLDDKKRKSLQSILASTQSAAMGAYDALSSIPYVGPFLGAAAAAGIYIVGGTAAAKVSGMAHDGIDAVPQTGTWLLEKGERVTTSKTSAKLDATLSNVNSKLDNQRNVTQMAPRQNTQNIYVNGQVDNRTATQIARESERQQRMQQRRLG